MCPTDSQTKSMCVYSESYLRNSRRLVRTILTNQFILVNQNDYFEATREHAILFREVGCLFLLCLLKSTIDVYDYFSIKLHTSLSESITKLFF